MPRQLKVDDEHLKTLEQRLAKAKRDLARARAVHDDQARRIDTRRKVIAGALALEHFEKNAGSEWGKIYFRLLDEYVLPRDRYLFEFLPVREAPPTSLKCVLPKAPSRIEGGPGQKKNDAFKLPGCRK
jgi:hypothetical protein